MSIIFDNGIPPLHADPDIDAMQMDVYCECPVYGDLPNIPFGIKDGQPVQRFRRVATMSSREMLMGYTAKDLAEQRERMVRELIEDVKRARSYSDYAIGLPEEFICRESNGKTMRLPKSIYTQFRT